MADTTVRVRLTSSKRPLPETVMELAEPGAQLGKRCVDLPRRFVTRYTKAQAEWWTCVALLPHFLRDGAK